MPSCPAGPVTPEEEADDSKPLLLVVEDNPDICNYIRGAFEETYTVLTAFNGQEGWETAKSRIPNIIVSDIMMPVMDGVTFCRKVKEDMRTSHIPVILLTAKGSIRAKEEGYEAGADSFITKPFSARLLQLRIEKLLEGRRKLASLITAVATESAAAPADTVTASERAETLETNTLTKLDQVFLEKVKTVIADHLSMEKMDVAFIADKMCMSHSTLYRKIKGLTNMSVNEFVRKMKMQKGLELIQQGERSIAEISDLTGFSSVAYFRQCFKEEFGSSPSEYQKKLQRNP